MRLTLILLFTCWSAVAGCLSFDAAAAGCQASSDELVWTGPTAPLVDTGRGRSFYDETIWATPPARGVSLDGDASFELKATGPHMVEVFLVVPDQWKRSYLLDAGGKIVDERWREWTKPDRMMPTARKRRLTLLAMVDGPTRVTVRTDSPEYVLTAVRWTDAETFESALVPGWLMRSRWLHRHGLFEERGFSPTDRRHRLQQVHARLYLSGNAEVKREAVIGLARAWYWLAAENHRPPEMARTAQIFRE
ncbi:MAG: hypothetical protein GY953_08920, partial [bacterium]|nr:hypothetical protein [bacterium]